MNTLARLGLLLLLSTGCAGGSAGQDEAVQIVAANLAANKLGIQAGDLKGRENPRGEGKFVYAEKTRYSGTERYVVWLVLDDQAYPLNGATKLVTPLLPWPREAPGGTWSRTGLGQGSAAEAIEIVFGKP